MFLFLCVLVPSRFDFWGQIVSQSWSVRAADSVIARNAPMSHEWHYENGVMLKAMEQVWQKTDDPKYFQFIKDTLDQFVEPDGNIRTYRLIEYNLDQINMGKALFPVWRETRDERYKRAAYLLRKQLRRQPRTREGGFWHKHIYPYQMWLDGIYMAEPYYAEFAETFEMQSPVNLPLLTGEGRIEIGAQQSFDDIAFQILTIEKHAHDPKTGLLYHGWDESKKQRWANPATGCSPHFWGRAIGWYAMAIVDTLDHFPHDHSKYGALIAVLQRVAEAITRVQDHLSGLWYQILDQPNRAGNYREASASCMIAYAMAKGAHLGYLEKKYLEVTRRAYNGILENFIQVDAQGMVNLNWTCGSAGLGGTPYRDGSFEYYVGERIVTNDYKGLGSFIMASVEME